jgi:hypothetical protein
MDVAQMGAYLVDAKRRIRVTQSDRAHARCLLDAILADGQPSSIATRVRRTCMAPSPSLMEVTK